MTLLIGTASDKHVLLTSDRRCTVEEHGKVSQVDTFQKIYPIPNRPLALVHHGENVFLDDTGNQISLSAVVAVLIRDNADVFEQLSIEAIIKSLADRLEPTARRTLANRGKKLIGFWVAGFARAKRNPEIWEACWYKDGRKEMKAGNNLFVGGDAQEHLPPSVRDRLDDMYHLDNIPKASVEYTRRYHNKLFDIALNQEPEPRCFSADRDQLVIEMDGCRWVTPPFGQDEPFPPDTNLGNEGQIP